MLWRICAAVILTIGSTSSTSGAGEALPACAAPPPDTLADLVAGLGAGGASAVPYREQISHPALAEPEIASGELRIDGQRLIKAQHIPTAEISEIGERLIVVRRDASDEGNTLPIPAQLVPVIDALRAAMTGEFGQLVSRARLDPAGEAQGWQIVVPSATASVPDLALRGCGARIRQIDIAEPGGVRRVFTLGMPG